MTQEEKAKRYDEAVKVAQRFYNNSVAITKKGLEDIFPELKEESEEESEDEKIRKAILKHFEFIRVEERLSSCFGVDIHTIIAWLEKQDEHAKFRDSIQVGDKVTRNQDGVLVNLSQLNRVAKKDEKQGEQPKKHDVCDYCDQQGSCVSPCPMKLVEKQGEQNPTYTKEYDFHGMKFIPKFAKGDIIKDKKRGEVSTIEGFSYDTGLYTHTYGQFPITIQDNYEIIAQNPAWSEEDEEMLKIVIKSCEQCGNEYAYYWLKSLKDRVQPKQEWSEDDKKMLNDILRYGEHHCYLDTGNIAWLKSIKDRIPPQPKQEWSEEDKKMIGNIRSIIEKYAFSQSAVDVNGELCEREYIEAENWLKSLRPQNRWKPSDEQMNALHDAAVYVDKSMFPYPKGILMKLYKQLKKLREE